MFSPVWSHLILIRTLEDSSTGLIIPFLQIRSRRLREANQLTKEQIGTEWQEWGFNPWFLTKMPLFTVLASYGCCNKFPQTGWHKQQIFILSWFWRLDVWNQGVVRASLPPEALGENSFFASFTFWWLLALLGLWSPHSSLCLCGHIASSFSILCLFLLCLSQISLCLSLIRTLIRIDSYKDWL